jgi:Protein of unknown function (DUF1559)
MNRLPGICFVLWAAGVLLAAPTPKSPPQSQPDSGAPEPVEPAVAPAKAADDPALRTTETANRATSSDNLKTLGLALHRHHKANNRLPWNVSDKDGKPLLSWRVQMLPYLNEVKLFKEFRFTEPWDGPTNGKLLERMPKVFESPRVQVKKKGYTVYQGFAGPGALFDPTTNGQLTFLHITDGMSNTLFAVESSAAVPWTKPADIPFDPKKELPDFGRAYSARPLAVFCDGSVRTLDLKKWKPEMLQRAITIADGFPLDPDPE